MPQRAAEDHRFISRDQERVASTQALVHALDGEHATARRWLIRAPSQSDADAKAGVESLLANALLAVDCLDWPRFDEVIAELDAISLNSRSHRDLLLYVRASAALVRGEQHQFLRQLGPGEQLRRGDHDLVAMRLPYVLGELALSVGDEERASAPLLHLDGSYLSALLSARLQLAQGNAQSVVHRLESSTWLDGAPRRGRIEMRLALATALDLIGEGAQAAHTIRQALTQAGSPTQIAYSLATTDQEILRAAAQRDAAIAVALTSVDTALFIPPFESAGSNAAPQLSRRERTVLELLASRSTAAEIAERLYVSVHTVRNQTQSIYRKLNANSRDQALKIAARYGHL